MSKSWTIAIAFGLILSACGGQIVSETFGNVGTELPEPTAIGTAEPTPAAESLAPFVEDTQLLGDVRVAGDQTISGQVVGTLTVARTGSLVLYGQVLEDLVANAGSRAEVYGMVLGDVINRGGDVTIYGLVEGEVIDEGATTTVIASGAIIGGETEP